MKTMLSKFRNLVLLMMLVQLHVSAQQVLPLNPGTVSESLVFQSKILASNVRYSIYLPPDYTSSNRRYPVVYLLHGLGDDETGWVQFGEVQMAADRAIAAREIPPMIIVMPDAGVTWYINDYLGKFRYEDMFIQEFIPFIDKTYRTRNEREFRGVCGLSMGGYGALIYALHHPDVFTACAAFSSAVRTDEEIIAMDEQDYNWRREKVFGPIKSPAERLSAYYRQNSVLDLVKTLPVDSISKLRFYIDCGDDDFLYKGNSMLHILMRDRHIAHEFRARDGEHSWVYWRTGITDGLKFIGQDFNR
jgi:S-formylglutathione hydrolase FrmB